MSPLTLLKVTASARSHRQTSFTAMIKHRHPLIAFFTLHIIHVTRIHGLTERPRFSPLHSRSQGEKRPSFLGPTSFKLSVPPKFTLGISSSSLLNSASKDNEILNDQLNMTPFTSTDNLNSSNQKKRFKILGICGGIGSGKSTACQLLLSDKTVKAHLDTDLIAHGVYAPGSDAIRDLIGEFGEGIILSQQEGLEEIDRKELGKIVFANPCAMSKLEQIVWPHVKSKIIERIQHIEATSIDINPLLGVVIVEAAVLLEAGWDDLLDATWVVTSPKSTCKQRLVDHRGMKTSDAEDRIGAQISRQGIGNVREEVENGRVTAVIHNDGSLKSLREKLKEAWGNPASWKDGDIPVGLEEGSDNSI